MNLVILLASTLRLATTTPHYIKDAQEDWGDLVKDVEVVSVECGEENAFYYPGDNRIVMCTELYANEDLAVAIFNHEMGHAFMEQHGIPNGEQAADELSFLMSTPAQLEAAAKWFLKWAAIYPHDPLDPHPADLDRAGSILCFLDGIDDHPQERACVMYAQSINDNWKRMLYLTTVE